MGAASQGAILNGKLLCASPPVPRSGVNTSFVGDLDLEERNLGHELQSLPLRKEGTVRNSVRWAMMMKRRESSHGYRERTSGPAPG
ncbi:hypothetical protein CN076_35415, partial [Sinorhizobium meliloti]